MLHEELDRVAMTRQRCLVQRRRMGVRALRIEAIRVLSQVEQQLDDAEMTELGRPRKGEMPVLRRGGRRSSAGLINPTRCGCYSAINSRPSCDQGVDRLELPVPQCCAHRGIGVRSVIAKQIDESSLDATFAHDPP